AQKDVAELAVRLHQTDQRFAVDLDQFARFCCEYSYQTTPSGEHIHLAGKHTRATNRKNLFLVMSHSKQLELALYDDKKLLRLLIRFDQCFAERNLAGAPLG